MLLKSLVLPRSFVVQAINDGPNKFLGVGIESGNGRVAMVVETPTAQVSQVIAADVLQLHAFQKAPNPLLRVQVRPLCSAAAPTTDEMNAAPFVVTRSNSALGWSTCNRGAIKVGGFLMSGAMFQNRG